MMTEKMSEHDLIEACRDGDREAFGVIFSRHQKRVFSVAIGFFGGNRQTAEDVTQQVFLKLYTSITNFRGDAKLETWLYRITINTCLDEQRKKKRMAYIPDFLGLGSADANKTHEEKLIMRETSDEVRRALIEIKPKFRLPIVLKYSEGLSYQEMAEVLGCSEGTIASRLNRGHKMLAKKLESLKIDF